MGINESIAPVEARKEKAPRLSFPALAKDVATLSGGTMLAAVFNALLVFLIPRLVSVEDFGYWRLFLLYSSYAGLMHLGLADGALLRWAGRPLEEFHHEIVGLVGFLACGQLIVIVPACLIAGFTLPPRMRFIVVAILAFALIMNPATVLQYGLQAARVFRPVAVATAAPMGGFLLLVLLWELRRTANFRELIVLYFLAWTAVLAYLWVRVGRRGRSSFPPSAWVLGTSCISLGWPILLANASYSLVAGADRLAVSGTLPIYDFAQYSLAASVASVPAPVIVAVFRVFFPHIAAVQHEERARVYAHISKFLFLAWSLLLPCYFGVELFVRRFLPKYLPALPVARILMLGAVFLAGISILQMSYFYLYGRQRQFLLQAGGALAVSFSLAFALAVGLHSLVAVAVGQVAALGSWWLFNEWKLREISGQGWRDWLRVSAVFVWTAGGYGLTLWLTPSAGWRVLIYYLLISTVLWLAYHDEIRLGWRRLRGI